MQDFFLFGAGINSYSTISFFGGNHILGIIDNDSKMQHQYILGIPVISFDEYMKNGEKKDILITAFYKGEEILSFLQHQGIQNAYRAPWMQNGFYRNPLEVIEQLGIKEYKEIVFLKRDPIATAIADEITNLAQSVSAVFLEDGKAVSSDSPIYITCLTAEDTLRLLQDTYPNHSIIQIHTIAKQRAISERVELKQFRNIHRGERCFICGNGPSLRVEDLDLLWKNGEISFGVNNVFYSFLKTKWRPTYYVAVDQRVLLNNRETICQYEGKKFIRSMMTPIERVCQDAFIFNGIINENEQESFSFDLVSGLYNGCTVIYEAIQIAYYMGFSEIYLLGVDMTDANIPVHFYQEDASTSQGWHKGDTQKAIRHLRFAYETLRDRGVNLRNATRDVKWNEVPKVDFDTLMKCK